MINSIYEKKKSFNTIVIKHREIETKGDRGRKIVLSIQTGFFGLPGTGEGLHGPYNFNFLVWLPNLHRMMYSSVLTSRYSLFVTVT